MKNTLTFCILSLFIILTGCSKDSNNEPDNNPGGGNPNPTSEIFTAKVDGNTFLADDAAAIEVVSEGVKSVSIVAGEGENRGISIGIPSFEGVGEYPLNDPTNPTTGSGAYFEGDMIWTLGEGSSGKVTITSYKPNESIAGTFYFTGKDLSNSSMKTVTDGQFNILLIRL